MKTLHVTFSYEPDPPGGTEIYVAALCQALQELGVEAVVAAPAMQERDYEVHSVRVRRFVTRDGDLANYYGRGDAVAAVSFAGILERERPDLVHQHALSPACSTALMREAGKRGLPLVFTYHTPTVSCQRGTLMEWGTTPCDGLVDARRCAACTLHGLGVGCIASRTLARVPKGIGELAGRAGLAGGPWTALRMRSLLQVRQEATREAFDLPDRLVSLCPWVTELFRKNGVPHDKVVLSAHGVSSGTRRPRLPSPRVRRTVRMVHLGRVDPAKGTQLLLEAFRAVPHAPIELDVLGVVQDRAAAVLHENLRITAAADPRVRLLPAVEHGAVMDTLADYDIVVVPSQCMETGPLVLLEAFAAGLPVIGSALGGIGDKVRDGVDGVLVAPYSSLDAWRDAIERCSDRAFVDALQRGVRPPRSMDDVTREMHALYQELIAMRQERSTDTIGLGVSARGATTREDWSD